jgi:quercetin dioxygenase-like cupin family protein
MPRQAVKPRSTNPRDYQNVARPFAAMAKSFADGFEIEPHHHKRDQLIYAVSGLMRVRTAQEAWIVPPDRAVYVPARTTHSISMRGAVEMRTLYIARDAHVALPAAATVMAVSDLLRELILALIECVVRAGTYTARSGGTIHASCAVRTRMRPDTA